MSRRWLAAAGLAAAVVVVSACAPCGPSTPPAPDGPPVYAPCGSIVCDAIGCPILPPDCPR